jgi:hypothetical protein
MRRQVKYRRKVPHHPNRLRHLVIQLIRRLKEGAPPSNE